MLLLVICAFCMLFLWQMVERRDSCLDTLASIDASEEDLMVGVDHVEDGISIELLTGCEHTNLEVWQYSLQHLSKVRPLEDTNFNHVALVLKRGEEVRLGVRAVDLLDIDIVDGGCME